MCNIGRGCGLILIDTPILTVRLVTGKHITKLHVYTADINPVVFNHEVEFLCSLITAITVLTYQLLLFVNS